MKKIVVAVLAALSMAAAASALDLSKDSLMRSMRLHRLDLITPSEIQNLR